MQDSELIEDLLGKMREVAQNQTRATGLPGYLEEHGAIAHFEIVQCNLPKILPRKGTRLQETEYEKYLLTIQEKRRKVIGQTKTIYTWPPIADTHTIFLIPLTKNNACRFQIHGPLYERREDRYGNALARGRTTFYLDNAKYHDFWRGYALLTATDQAWSLERFPEIRPKDYARAVYDSYELGEVLLNCALEDKLHAMLDFFEIHRFNRLDNYARARMIHNLLDALTTAVDRKFGKPLSAVERDYRAHVIQIIVTYCSSTKGYLIRKLIRSAPEYAAENP